MAYDNYVLEKNKCKWCWMERERPDLFEKVKRKR